MPDGTALTLALVLTAGGATASALLISGIIQLLKGLPTVGAWVGGGNEGLVAFVLSAALVIFAFSGTLVGPITAEGIFAALLAWFGIAQIATASHDTAAKLHARWKAAD